MYSVFTGTGNCENLDNILFCHYSKIIFEYDSLAIFAGNTQNTHVSPPPPPPLLTRVYVINGDSAISICFFALNLILNSVNLAENFIFLYMFYVKTSDKVLTRTCYQLFFVICSHDDGFRLKIMHKSDE